MDLGKPMASGVTVIASGAPSSYHVASRMESSEHGAPEMAPQLMSGVSERKKRGRPRKYKPEESSNRVLSSPSSGPLAPGMAYGEDEKLHGARSINSEKKHKSKIGSEKLDDWVECCTGSSFLPHVINVNVGEDISTKITEFSRQGPRAVCIVSGSGTVSNVTIQHPNSSGGLLTYEGLFEILSFSGSFTPMETCDSKLGRSGMMTITLSGADGRVVGGLIAGLTVAATPVKVVVVSFLLSNPHETKTRKQFAVDSSAPNDDAAEKRGSNPNYPDPENPTNWAVMQSAERARKSTADINISLHG